jgi:hypothetical protein
MEDQANAGKILGDSQARGKIVFVSVHQALRVTQLTTDENGRNAIVEARNSSCCAIRGHSTWWGPTISVPCGFTKEGLPIGVQIAGPRGGEATVLRLAYAYEQATEWHKRRPNLG